MKRPINEGEMGLYLGLKRVLCVVLIRGQVEICTVSCGFFVLAGLTLYVNTLAY